MVLKISGFGQSDHVDYMYVILFIVCPYQPIGAYTKKKRARVAQ
jgi:hypothetical protein